MKIEIEILESDVKAAVLTEIARRIKERLPYHSDYLRTTVDQRIRRVTEEVVLENDIRAIVGREVSAAFDKILADTVRHQVKSIVRLAIQKELAALKAEQQIELDSSIEAPSSNA